MVSTEVSIFRPVPAVVTAANLPRVTPEHVTVTAPAATVAAASTVTLITLAVYAAVEAVAGLDTLQAAAPSAFVISPAGNVRVMMPDLSRMRMA